MRERPTGAAPMTERRVDRAIPDAAVIRDAVEAAPSLYADDEHLRRMRCVCYPAWRVTAAYESGGAREETVVLLDGTWSGNEEHLAAYAAGSDPTATVDHRYGNPMTVRSKGDPERARRVFEDWIDRWREALPESSPAEGDRLRERLALPAEFGPDSFEAVTEVVELVLPFWVLELAAGEDTWLLSVRSGEPLLAGDPSARDEWLANLLGEHDGFYERFHRPSPDDETVGDGTDDGDAPRSERSQATTSETASTTPSPGGDVVQPEDANLQADRLMEPPPSRTFADVGGLDGLEETLREQVIRPLRHPERYERYGLGTTDGVLLHGPPGCGKTYVAGALAGELGRSFLPISPTDLTSKWVGEAADNVADAFAVARANSPCLVFLDEIDAVAADRGSRMTNTERQLVNQLLAELEALDDDVVVVAATNRLEAIDDAILRSGRFDERVEVPPPDPDARREVLAVHLADRPTAEGLSLGAAVDRTAGLAASDLELVVERAAREAMEAGEAIGEKHLLGAASETASSIPTWTDGYDLGGGAAAFGPVAGTDVSQPPGVGRDATEVVSGPPDREFAAVPGMSAEKAALRERVLAPALDQERYADYGLGGVDGALLYGPPGCGKTHLARAVAGEVGCHFVHLRPGDLFGESGNRPAEAVTDLFEIARANVPCVLFVDDLDEISGRGRVLTGRHQRLLTQLSTELRAISESAVLVLGAAQVVGDVGETLLHAGCFDERVEVPPPGPETREAVLRAGIDDRLLGAVAWDAVVERAAGYAIGDLVLVAETAARRAVSDDEQVTTDHLLTALGRVNSTIADWEYAGRYEGDDHGSDLRYIG